jgi:very-short-patch-repair endonuclease
MIKSKEYPKEWLDEINKREQEQTKSYWEFLEKVRNEQIENASEYEQTVFSLLSSSAISFDYQKILKLEEKKGIVVDFFLKDFNTVLEIDGKGHDVVKDSQRDLAIWQEYGYYVARVECCKVGSLTKENLIELIKNTKDFYKTEQCEGSLYINEEGLSKLRELTFNPLVAYKAIEAGYITSPDGITRRVMLQVMNDSITSYGKYKLLLASPMPKKKSAKQQLLDTVRKPRKKKTA